jgi:hypothetical protein
MPAREPTFPHEICNAIDTRARVLLVLGPEATTAKSAKTASKVTARRDITDGQLH